MYSSKGRMELDRGSNVRSRAGRTKLGGVYMTTLVTLDSAGAVMQKLLENTEKAKATQMYKPTDTTDDQILVFLSSSLFSNYNGQNQIKKNKARYTAALVVGQGQ